MKNKTNQKNNDTKKSNKTIYIINTIYIVIIIILISFILNKPILNDVKITRDNNNSFKFTSPILDCENVNNGNDIVVSTEKVSDKIKELKNKYGVGAVSLYFRDLNNGPWVGVGENEVFSPASLLKIPVVMGLLKYAETNPEILNKEIQITESDIEKDSIQNIIFPNVLKKDTKYTLEQIVESVIKNSDNAGIPIILNNVSPEYIGNVFYSTGVPYKDLSNEVNLNVKDYSGFFRVLYNSSYLNREMSEKLLKMLSENEYVNGLVAGVPKDVVVAHKFGERRIDDINQLHDCGIVYHKSNPYIICIMTRGSNFSNLESVIKDLSSYIYQEVDKKK